MLQSYSAVYCGDQQRSYHGTTLQLVQPGVSLSPSTELQYEPETAATATDTEVEMTTPPLQSPHSNMRESIQAFAANQLNQQQMSPESSSHREGMHGPKRQMTVTVNSLVPTATRRANLDTLPSPQLTLTFESFLENSDQATERIVLQNKLLSLMLYKSIAYTTAITQILSQQMQLSVVCCLSVCQ